MCTISIIIPVYNVENFLEECIKSVLKQNYKNYEIILVNDGSTDGSSKICDYYAEKISFISVIHKKNGGLSDARNVGIKNAKGNYILFIDSDDFIHENSLFEIEKVLIENKNIDVIFLKAFKYYKNKKIVLMDDNIKKDIIIKKDNKDVLKYISSLSKFPASACTKLVKRELILKKEIYFKKDLLSEDVDWTLNLLLNAKSFNYCSFPYYYYRQNRDGSITNRSNIRNLESYLYIIDKWSNFNEENQALINSFLSYQYLVLLINYSLCSDNLKKNEVKKYSWLLNFGKTKKIKLLKYIYLIFGLTLTSRMIGLSYKLKEKIKGI